MKNIAIIYLFLFAIGCSRGITMHHPEKLKQELKDAEQSFSNASAQKGFYHAMLDVAADEIALFNDGDTILHNIDFIKKSIAKYPNGTKAPFKITWEAKKIDVAASGDLGYTYGWFILTRKDSLGNEKITKGLYSSVWKKINGTWRLVMD